MTTTAVTITLLGPDAPFVLWRCLHSGPLDLANIDHPEPNPQVDWPLVRARNLPLLAKLAETYGAYAVAALMGSQVVGQLRFYPRAVLRLGGGDEFCMQQLHPHGPSAALADLPFPPLEALPDRTLLIHCMMVGSPHQAENPYRRKGIALRMVNRLVEWARERGWDALAAYALEDLPLLYAISGAAGRSFWRKAGFAVGAPEEEPALSADNDFTRTLREQCLAAGLAPDAYRFKYPVTRDLRP